MDGAADDEGAGEVDEVIYDEPALGGEEQGVRALDRAVRLDHEYKEPAAIRGKKNRIVSPTKRPVGRPRPIAISRKPTNGQ